MPSSQVMTHMERALTHAHSLYPNEQQLVSQALQFQAHGASSSHLGRRCAYFFIRGELQSPNADFAEWYRRADEAEEIRDGDVVLHQGHRISRREREGSPPVSFWSVVSSRPCVKGGVPSDDDARKVGSHGLLSA